jgi:hypothetical protein
MIMAVVVIAGVFFLFCLTLGVRARQPLAIVASFFVLATLYCWFGLAGSALMTGDSLASNLWLAAFAICLILACVLAFTAWRRSSGSR